MSMADRLRNLLAKPGILVLPGCYDAVSAKLIEKAGFQASFMGGFAVAASRIGMPDTGLISYAEMVDQGRNICGAVTIPIIGDGDTGYGNAVNVQRTVRGYAQSGFACIMIEDQVAPKRCGHTRGKQTVSRKEAFARIRAAIDTRDSGADILIMARTDANATEGLEEAIFRAKKFAEMGVDITFVEALRNEEEMRIYCESVPGLRMANMVEQGETPVFTPSKLQEIGYKVVVYPITLMLSSIRAMEDALLALQLGRNPKDIAEFQYLREIVGFPEYYEEEQKYTTD